MSNKSLNHCSFAGSLALLCLMWSGSLHAALIISPETTTVDLSLPSPSFDVFLDLSGTDLSVPRTDVVSFQFGLVHENTSGNINPGDVTLGIPTDPAVDDLFPSLSDPVFFASIPSSDTGAQSTSATTTTLFDQARFVTVPFSVLGNKTGTFDVRITSPEIGTFTPPFDFGTVPNVSTSIGTITVVPEPSSLLLLAAVFGFTRGAKLTSHLKKLFAR